MTILVIGEYCVDKFVYCETNRLSPEAPVPVLTPKYIVQNDGMAGNVVRNIIAIEKTASILGTFQKDEPITKTRYIDEKSNHMFFRVDEGDNVVTPFKLTKKIVYDILWSDAIIVSDYDKGFLTQKDLYDISVVAANRFSILDTKKIIDKSTVSYFKFIKLNEKERERNKDIAANPNYLNKFITTLGAKGAKYKDKIYPSTAPKETIDVSGAGDTFISAFTIKYLQTNSIEESIIFANDMCSIVVSKRGVTTP
jgi:D-beta-D-heptose 7-phosphate kinase/D-beta-D-heptose 1-phosphate adenosyltransferase